MVPKLRQHENFLTSNFCIPGLARIPNHTVMEALTPRCIFIFTLTLTPLKFSSVSGAQREYTYSPTYSSPLCAEFQGSTMLASVCVYTMCRDWSPGSLTPPALSAAQANFKEMYHLSE